LSFNFGTKNILHEHQRFEAEASEIYDARYPFKAVKLSMSRAPKIFLNIGNQHKYRAFALAVTYLVLLLIMKIKILRGYPFLWPENLQSFSPNILAKLDVFNPAFYVDDIFVAFVMYLIFYFVFKKNILKLNKIVYISYFVICFFSILSSFAFYKYEAPLNVAILSQIDSIYTMRTSIDTELMENYRLFLFFSVLLFFAVTAPVLLNFLKNRISSRANNLPKVRFMPAWMVISFIFLAGILLAKNYYFGMNIVTETPITTLSKSITNDLTRKAYGNSVTIPEFDDQIELAASKNISKKSLLATKSKKKYNVILVVLETTNYTFFSPSGPYIKYFPNFHKISKDGLYFPNFFSPFPRSSKAFFAILTGFYPLTNYKSVIKIAPQIEVPSMFSILKDLGYSTFAGYSGDFNYDRMADFLESRGVDKFVDINDNDGKYKQISWCADDELIYDRLIDWMESLQDNEPFFGFLLPMNTHHPFWTPKKKFSVVSEKNKIDRYINALHYQDILLGKLLLYLKESNKLDNTIVLITGDHGAVFKTLNQGDAKASPHMFDYTPYRVPLFIHAPFETSFKSETDIVGSHVDILPTILDMLGINYEKQIQGRSLFDPNIRNRISYIYTDYYKHIVAGLSGNFYMLRDVTGDHTVLSKNLNFQPDLCEDKIELCNRMKAKIEEFDKYQNLRLYSYFR